MQIERYLTQDDATILSKLAERMLRVGDAKFDAGEQLIALLSKAILLPENSPKKNCVSIYSEVTYCEIGRDERKTITIVSPRDANQILARVSVLAPLAMAMIGREVGSIVEVRLLFDQVQFVKILDVTHLSSSPVDQALDAEATS